MWVIIALIWGLVAGAVCMFLPFWESRKHLAKIFKSLVSAKMSTPPGQATPFPGDSTAAAAKDVTNAPGF